jgi:hypothetical protein
MAGNAGPVHPPAGWTLLTDGKVVPVGAWNDGPHGGGTSAAIVCLRQQGQAPVFEGVLKPDGKVALLDRAGHQVGVGTFTADGTHLQVTQPDGMVRTIDLAGTTMEISARGHTSAVSVESDGQLHPALVSTGTGGSASGSPNDPLVTTTDGRRMPLSQWLQQGPTVIAPNGQPMTQNMFAYLYGNDPKDPWVFPPNGPAMRRSQYAKTGPMVIAPGGKSMHMGEFNLTHPYDPNNQWMFFKHPGNPNAYNAITRKDWEQMMSVNIEQTWLTSAAVKSVAPGLAGIGTQAVAAINSLKGGALGSGTTADRLRKQLEEIGPHVNQLAQTASQNASGIGKLLANTSDGLWKMEQGNLEAMGGTATDKRLGLGKVLSLLEEERGVG